MNKEFIDKLKAEFETVYQIVIGKQTFIFRPLGRIEYAEIVVQDLELGLFQEEICTKATLYPINYDFSIGLGGTAETLSDQILDASGLHEGQIFDILMDYRLEMDNFDFQIDSIIHEVYPEYPIEEIERWPIRKTLYYYSRAEWVLRNVRGVQAETFFLLDELIKRRVESLNGETEQTTEDTNIDTNEKEALINEFTQPEPVPVETKPEPSDDAKEQERRMLELMRTEAASRGMTIGEVQTDIGKLPEQKWFLHDEELTGDYE